MNPVTVKVNEFLESKQLAIVGASRDYKKFGYKVFFLLKSKGYKLYPVHPEATEIDGVVCYKSVNDVPFAVRNILILTPKVATEKVIADVAARGYDLVWIQQESETPAAIELAKRYNMNLILHRCIFMFLDPQGAHKVHRFFYRVFGKI